jgi:hypothetical protein
MTADELRAFSTALTKEAFLAPAAKWIGSRALGLGTRVARGLGPGAAKAYGTGLKKAVPYIGGAGGQNLARNVGYGVMGAGALGAAGLGTAGYMASR